MGVIKQEEYNGRLPSKAAAAPPRTPASLQVLTAAALVLPGLLQTPAQAAEDDSVDFQYSHYQEGKRDIYGMTGAGTNLTGPTKLNRKFSPIEVDSQHGSSRITLTDRIKFAFNYTQDTWSGATPVATAAALVGGNRLYRFTNPKGEIDTGPGASPLIYDVKPLYLDKNLNAIEALYDGSTGEYSPGAINNQLTHVLSTASPETRKQGDFRLSYVGMKRLSILVAAYPLKTTTNPALLISAGAWISTRSGRP